MNLSFCGCGFVGIYHLGVAVCLKQHGRGVFRRLKKVAGVSSGAQIGTVVAVNQDKIEECVKFTYDLAAEIRSKRFGQLTPGYDLYVTLQQFLEYILPSDAYKIATDKLYISLTHLTTRKNKLVHTYSSNDELIQCVLASSYIPGYSKMPAPIIKGHKYFDGGWTDNMVKFPEGRTVLVSPFYSRTDISPETEEKGRYIKVKNQIVKLDRHNIYICIRALFPPPRDVLNNFYNQGYTDAGRFLKRNGLYDK